MLGWTCIGILPCATQQRPAVKTCFWVDDDIQPAGGKGGDAGPSGGVWGGIAGVGDAGVGGYDGGGVGDGGGYHQSKPPRVPSGGIDGGEGGAAGGVDAPNTMWYCKSLVDHFGSISLLLAGGRIQGPNIVLQRQAPFVANACFTITSMYPTW